MINSCTTLFGQGNSGTQPPANEVAITNYIEAQ